MLSEFLAKNKSAVLQKWFDVILETYPQDARKFFKKANNAFGNPVGSSIHTELESIYDGLVDEKDCQALSLSLENIARIRAVQDFPPSQAIGFVFSLRTIVRDELKKDAPEDMPYDELARFDSVIERMGLMIFDSYSQCREKVFEIRATELRKRSSKLLEMVNRKYDGVGHEQCSLDDEKV
jgi:RsbT co-antagonist protein rsbRD N-terminal domain